MAGLLGLTTTTNLRLDVEEYLAGLCPLRCLLCPGLLNYYCSCGFKPLAGVHLLCTVGILWFAGFLVWYFVVVW